MKNTGTLKVTLQGDRETVLTRVFDVVQDIPWPPIFPGRALANAFTRQWHGHESDLAKDEAARREFQSARQAEDYSKTNLYAGQSVGLLDRIEPAAAIIDRITTEAEACLRAASAIPS